MLLYFSLVSRLDYHMVVGLGRKSYFGYFILLLLHHFLDGVEEIKMICGLKCVMFIFIKFIRFLVRLCGFWLYFGDLV